MGQVVRQRSIAQEISFVIAIISYLLAIGCIGATVYYANILGGDHPVSASFGAAVVFFFCVGVVLHVIGRVDLPDLSIRGDKTNLD